MEIPAPPRDRSSTTGAQVWAPWPDGDRLQADADSAWAIALGLVDEADVGGADRGTSHGPAALLDRLDDAAVARHRATAAEYDLIHRVLRDALDDPDPWVGPDPTLDGLWHDPRGRTPAAVRRDRLDMAERAAVAEIAVRLRLAEQTVRSRAAHAGVLRERCPGMWAAFTEGRVSERHAVEAARLAATLPEDRDAWGAFDLGALDRALRLAPARFATAARVLRERVHAESLEARHGRARGDRGVWMTAELDGMATLTAFLPADRAAAAMTRLDRTARHLATADDETRTLAQLRADVFADLLSGAGPAVEATHTHVSATPGTRDRAASTTPAPARPSVIVTIPALTGRPAAAIYPACSAPTTLPRPSTATARSTSTRLGGWRETRPHGSACSPTPSPARPSPSTARPTGSPRPCAAGSGSPRRRAPSPGAPVRRGTATSTTSTRGATAARPTTTTSIPSAATITVCAMRPVGPPAAIPIPATSRGSVRWGRTSTPTRRRSRRATRRSSRSPPRAPRDHTPARLFP